MVKVLNKIKMYGVVLILLCLSACNKNEAISQNENIKMMQGKWYSSTFIVDGKLLSLKDYYNLMIKNDTTNQNFISWPTMNIDNDKVSFGFMGEVYKTSLKIVGGDVYAVNTDSKSLDEDISMIYDKDLDYMYVKGNSSDGHTICEVYGRISDDFSEKLRENILGKWAFIEKEIDGKVVNNSEFNKFYEGAKGQSDEMNTADIRFLYNEDGTLDISQKYDLINKTSYEIDSDGFYIHNSDDFDSSTYSYDDYYNVIRLMPKKEGRSLTAILMRTLGANGGEDVSPKLLEGTWELGFSTYGGEFNNKIEYEKIKKYFGYDLYHAADSEFIFNDDGTGKFNNISAGTVEDFTYEILSKSRFKLTYPDFDNYSEILTYSKGLDAILYENGNILNGSGFALYRKKR